MLPIFKKKKKKKIPKSGIIQQAGVTYRPWSWDIFVKWMGFLVNWNGHSLNDFPTKVNIIWDCSKCLLNCIMRLDSLYCIWYRSLWQWQLSLLQLCHLTLTVTVVVPSAVPPHIDSDSCSFSCATSHWQRQLFLQLCHLTLTATVVPSAVPPHIDSDSCSFSCATSHWQWQLLFLQLCHLTLTVTVVVPSAVPPHIDSDSCCSFSCATSQVVLESKKSKASSTNTKKAADAKGGRTKKENTKDTGLKGPAKPQAPDNSFKYEQYFNFQCPVRHIKPHQVTVCLWICVYMCMCVCVCSVWVCMCVGVCVCVCVCVCLLVCVQLCICVCLGLCLTLQYVFEYVTMKYTILSSVTLLLDYSIKSVS